jgi:hypothetical protein
MRQASIPILACLSPTHKGDYTLKSGEIIGIAALFAILLGIAMSALGPGTRGNNAWQYLANGNGTTSQVPATGPSIVGGPSLSAAKIDTILSNAGSPAAGTGNIFVLNSATYNIDNAVALAFMHHESSYGTRGIAVQTHSLGNIRCTDGYSCIGGFRAYPSWAEGIADWYRLISGPAYVGGGLTTVAQIIPKYAPSSDNNDESGYIANVQADVNAWRTS